ncbi:hypothetical protein DNTS_001135 [Danionella cerebrum]|uniref:Uncharacterized protein n=1 Tax=Danionella cerebrum TaxID=2873325 RepID=A0A553QBG5_9TELE|nr:hypothetical protein DNTS_001135 [Danionella translucida]
MTEIKADLLCLSQRPEHSEKPKLKKKELSKGKRPRKSETTDESDDPCSQTQGPEPPKKPRTMKKELSKGKRPRKSETTDESDDPCSQTQGPEPPKKPRTMKKEGKQNTPTGSSRRPWSKYEKNAVQRQLGNFIILRKVPGKEECMKALHAEASLQSRSWKDIKNQVYNTIVTLKRRE